MHRSKVCSIRDAGKCINFLPVAWLVALVLVSLTIVAGCGGGESPEQATPTSGGSGQPAEQAMPTATPDPTEASTSPGTAFSRALGAGVEEDWVDWDKIERDWKALVALYNATGGDNWTNNEGWLTETPLKDWYGILILRDGTVDILNLGDNNLIGEIPAELANLTARDLDLSKNRLSGEIPEGLCSGISLDLWNNQLSGQIPQGLVDCGTSTLYLHNNQLSGEIPAELGEEPELRRLRLDNNQLSGEIPGELANSTMTDLNLANNQLSGEIGAVWADLPKLWSLDLSGNPLSGCIPADMKYLDADFHYYFPEGMTYCE